MISSPQKDIKIRRYFVGKGLMPPRHLRAIFNLAFLLHKDSTGKRHYQMKSVTCNHWYEYRMIRGLIYNPQTRLYLAYKLDEKKQLKIIDNQTLHEAAMFLRDPRDTW